jgi:site-specific recombinase XerD
LRGFGQYLGSRGYDLPDVTGFVVNDYLVQLRGRQDSRATNRPRKLSPTTVQDVHASMRAFANFLRKGKLIPRTFMEGVETPKVPALPPVTVPDEVLLSIIDVLNPKRPPKG